MSKRSDNANQQVLCKPATAWRDGGSHAVEDNSVDLSRVHRFGTSCAVIIPQRLLRFLCWKRGDRLALRLHGDRILIERIPLERLALLRKPEEVEDAQ